MPKVFIAQGDCGDYYCDEEHLLGVFSNAEKANEAGEIYSVRGLHHQYRVFALTIDEPAPTDGYGYHK